MRLLSVPLMLGLSACLPQTADEPPDFIAQLAGFEHQQGFIDLYRDAQADRLYLGIEQAGDEFIYQSSLARGVGSNDLGLDRGQLGATQLVEFERHGNRLLLVAKNLGYRANTRDADERNAVEASFAKTVLWGFEIAGEQDGTAYIDATEFFLRDAHGIGRRLKDAGEGDYSVDAARSALYAPRTRAFPDNTEVEAIVTYQGEPIGEQLPTVAPDATAISVHLHHSLIRLPDDGYEPLPYDPRAGLIGLRYEDGGFLDYASAVGEPLRVRYARRHRLQKKSPGAARSEALQPIVYYLDPGAPEPVRSALLEGASWWSQAFEAAGYDNAFRVEMLPPGVDPLDVRYNVIQWVHRSTRGWSYGSSVLDPRTGEILKGHVTLGSLRVRQDYMLAEGLLAPYADDEVPEVMLEMSLARIRQLSAHEVGHTLGIEHNFAASTQGRSSVMDYPFPLIRFDDAGNLDLSAAFGSGIGGWDKRVILYGYQNFAADVDAPAARTAIVRETNRRFRYVADQDARAVGSAHPDGNLWDNGADAIAELEHLLRVREYALGRFSGQTIRPGQPLATLQDVLVPIYLLHRYQLQAVGKLLGGQYFSYALRGDGQEARAPVSGDRQRAALRALLATLDPARLRLPEPLLDLLPARPPGYPRTRETFAATTGGTFDPLAPAQSSVSLTLDVLLDPTRAARMVVGQARDPATPGFVELCNELLRSTWYADRGRALNAEIQRSTNMRVLERLMRLAVDETAALQVRAIALDTVNTLDEWLASRSFAGDAWRAHYRLARARITEMREDPAAIRERPADEVPPGSPIGDQSLTF